MRQVVKRWLLIALGWLLLVVGIVALPLPGPGAMIILLAMFVLATQYEWAERRLEGIRDWALAGAADTVRSWPRIMVSLFGVVWLLGFGILWCKHPSAPVVVAVGRPVVARRRVGDRDHADLLRPGGPGTARLQLRQAARERRVPHRACRAREGRPVALSVQQLPAAYGGMRRAAGPCWACVSVSGGRPEVPDTSRDRVGSRCEPPGERGQSVGSGHVVPGPSEAGLGRCWRPVREARRSAARGHRAGGRPRAAGGPRDV